MFNEKSLDAWCAPYGGLHAIRYVSMPNELKRRKAFQAIAAKLFPRTIQYVDAVSGIDVLRHNQTLKGIADSVSWHNVLNNKKRETHEAIYTVGAVGCAISHVREIENASRAPGCVLVLESDATVNEKSHAAWKQITDSYEHIPQEADAVWLHLASERDNVYDYQLSNNVQGPSKHFRLILGPIFSMTAVLYTPVGARKILSALSKDDARVNNQIDAVIGSLAARYKNHLTLLSSVNNVVKLSPESLVTTVQTISIKVHMPSSNWFYIGAIVAFIVLVISTATLGALYATKQRQWSGKKTLATR